MTRHNGRAGTHGTYNPKHNDRSFNLSNSEHIDPERAKGNIYWDCYHGIRSASDKDKQTAAFSDVEKMFYEIHYSHFVENQNARNAKIRHTERNRTIEDLLAGKKTCPEETIYQIFFVAVHLVLFFFGQALALVAGFVRGIVCRSNLAGNQRKY
ncbi:MAG: hypothetical protein ACLUVA_08230 [Faecalibacterium sp.]